MKKLLLEIISYKNMLKKIGLVLMALFLVVGVGAGTADAALTLGALTVTSDGALTLDSTSAAITLGSADATTVTVTTDGGSITLDGKIVLSPTFTAAGSDQSVEADATLSAFTGGYGAGAMGHVMGDLAAGDSIVAGLIGKYNVSDGGDSDHPQAGVVGEVGEESASTADAAFLAVIGGDSGAIDAGAAYGVRVLNSTAGSQFTYGLDLFSAAIDSYIAVSYATADIRLQNGELISNGTDGTILLGGTAGNTVDIGSAASNASIRSGTAVPTTCTTGDIFIDTDSANPAAALYVCDSDADGDGVFDAVAGTDG